MLLAISTSTLLTGLFGFLIASMIVMYNSLVSARNSVKESFALVDVYLKQRFDLIPNLVETVKQYMAHEQNLLTQITALRAKMSGSALSDAEKINLGNEVGRAFSQFTATAENYPALKANESFQYLQQTWYSIEENIAASRRIYNTSVKDFNNRCEQFPSNLFAGMFGFTAVEMLAATEEERQNVSAKDLFNK